MTALERHWLTRPRRDAWTAMLAAHPELAAEPLLAGWADRGWPLIRRRPVCGDLPGMEPLGLPLPPGQGKRRIALCLPRAGLEEAAPPPLLADCLSVAPSAWRPAMEALLMLDARTRCFGGLAWQYLTGLPYLSANSDLDLLWQMPAELSVFLAALARIAETAPMRLDGELAGDSGAVQWRELVSGAPALAVKTADGVMLMPRAAFLAGGAA